MPHAVHRQVLQVVLPNALERAVFAQPKVSDTPKSVFDVDTYGMPGTPACVYRVYASRYIYSYLRTPRIQLIQEINKYIDE